MGQKCVNCRPLTFIVKIGTIAERFQGKKTIFPVPPIVAIPQKICTRGRHLGQKCLNRKPITFWGKIGIIAQTFPGKMTIFPVLALFFHFISGICTDTEVFLEIRKNKGICYQSLKMLSLTLLPTAFYNFLSYRGIFIPHPRKQC